MPSKNEVNRKKNDSSRINGEKMKKCTKIEGNKINTNEMNDTESIQKKKKY